MRLEVREEGNRWLLVEIGARFWDDEEYIVGGAANRSFGSREEAEAAGELWTLLRLHQHLGMAQGEFRYDADFGFVKWVPSKVSPSTSVSRSSDGAVGAFLAGLFLGG